MLCSCSDVWQLYVHCYLASTYFLGLQIEVILNVVSSVKLVYTSVSFVYRRNVKAAEIEKGVIFKHYILSSYYEGQR